MKIPFSYRHHFFNRVLMASFVGHIFLLGQPALDMKIHPSDALFNLGIRAVSKEDIKLDVEITQDANDIRIVIKHRGTEEIVRASDFFKSSPSASSPVDPTDSDGVSLNDIEGWLFSDSLDGIMEGLINTSVEKTNASYGSIVLFLEDNPEYLYFAKATGPFEEMLRTILLEKDKGFTGQVIHERRAFYVNDLSLHPSPSLAKEKLDTLLGHETKSLLLIPLEVKREIIGVLELINKKTEGGFNDEDMEKVKRIARIGAFAINQFRLVQDVKNASLERFRASVSMLEAKHPYTSGHTARVSLFSWVIAAQLGLSEKVKESLELAAVLHDLGKIGVPDEILDKPGRLSDEEFEHIKSHPARGAEMLGPRENAAVIRGVRGHHERWDGKGYPDGFREKEIPLEARIISVADAFDAMTSGRSYRKGMPFGKVVGILKEEKGKQFDPEIVEAFLKVLAEETTVHWFTIHNLIDGALLRSSESQAALEGLNTISESVRAFKLDGLENLRQIKEKIHSMGEDGVEDGTSSLEILAGLIEKGLIQGRGKTVVVRKVFPGEKVIFTIQDKGSGINNVESLLPRRFLEKAGNPGITAALWEANQEFVFKRGGRITAYSAGKKLVLSKNTGRGNGWGAEIESTRIMRAGGLRIEIDIPLATADRGSASSPLAVNRIVERRGTSSLVEDQAKRNDEERSSLFEELYKFFDGDAGILKNALQRPAVNFTVVGNNQSDLFSGKEKFDMAAALPDFDVSSPQKGMDDFIAGEQGRFHIVRLKTLWDALDRISLGLGSKYNNMASLMFLMTSLSVLPWLRQPGSEGALATMYPSWPFSSTILIFMGVTSQNKHTIRAWPRQGQFDVDTTSKVLDASSPLDTSGKTLSFSASSPVETIIAGRAAYAKPTALARQTSSSFWRETVARPNRLTMSEEETVNSLPILNTESFLRPDAAKFLSFDVSRNSVLASVWGRTDEIKAMVISSGWGSAETITVGRTFELVRSVNGKGTSTISPRTRSKSDFLSVFGGVDVFFRTLQEFETFGLFGQFGYEHAGYFVLTDGNGHKNFLMFGKMEGLRQFQGSVFINGGEQFCHFIIPRLKYITSLRQSQGRVKSSSRMPLADGSSAAPPLGRLWRTSPSAGEAVGQGRGSSPILTREKVLDLINQRGRILKGKRVNICRYSKRRFGRIIILNMPLKEKRGYF